MSADVARLEAALDELMEEINKPTPASKRRSADLRSGVDQEKMDREKLKGEALGLARAIAMITEQSVEDVRQAAIQRYVG